MGTRADAPACMVRPQPSPGVVTPSWLNVPQAGGRCVVAAKDPIRFSVPLYTVADAARIVDVPPSTLHDWVHGYTRSFADGRSATGEAIVTRVESSKRTDPVIPFVGLVEAMVLAAVRRSRVPLQRIRPALDQLQREIGVEHALASRKLYTDGAEILYDFGERPSNTDDGRALRGLVVVRNGQRVFTDVVEAYLSRITYGADGYPELIRVPAYEHADVVADPTRSFGAPIFERGGVRIADVLERFWAGDTLGDLVDEFGVPADQLEDVLRVASRRAA